MRLARLAPLLAVVAAGGCLREPLPTVRTEADAAERYTRLVLHLGQHDAAFVDAYYGPPEWQAEAKASPMPLREINTAAAVLEVDMRRFPAVPDGAPDAELVRLRRQYLARQVNAVRTRITMLQGRKYSFDEESRELYDAVAPRHTAQEFQAVVDEIGRALPPGDGDVVQRYAAFKQQFAIPRDKLDAVFQAAIAACRERTRAHVTLPPGESFTVEYVTGKPWSGYNWYQGGFKSLIQVNTDLPIFVDRAIDLACHEGYPGHHVYNALLEQRLVRERGWTEFSVYALFSPQSLIAEGTANFGIEVAFDPDERRAFEREVLFPLAGLDAAKVDQYYDVMALVDRLSYAGNEAARQYLDGAIGGEAAASWLQRYAMMPAPQAAQRVKFFDAYRSYVINYNLGKDLVRAWVERQGGTADQPAKRWELFTALLSSPRLPSGLAAPPPPAGAAR